MKILVLDTGSSSLKCDIYDMATGKELFARKLERLESPADALAEVAKTLPHTIDAIGHRVAHGGAMLIAPTLLTPGTIAQIEACVPLAPLHNPPALFTIRQAQALWPDLPQVGVFDTAFHRTLPEYAFTYAVPRTWREAGLRRYGFHGPSHHYIMERVAEELGTPADKFRLISCHLGNGASICAIAHGKSVDTSMGLTALEGLVMGTRSGDTDPGLYGFIHTQMGLSIEEIERALYHDSGLAGLSGTGNDLRDIEAASGQGNADASLAFNVFIYRLRKYIGAYTAAMGGVDVLAFTGGIGENSVHIRAAACAGFEYLGLMLDAKRNAAIDLSGYAAPCIEAAGTKVKILVTETREQWMIAKETHKLLQGKNHD